MDSVWLNKFDDLINNANAYSSEILKEKAVDLLYQSSNSSLQAKFDECMFIATMKNIAVRK